MDINNGDYVEAALALTEGVVDTEVETTVDDDTDNRGDEATVETGNTVGRESLLVDVNEAVELTSSSTLGRLRVVGETRTRVVERVHEEQRRGTSCTTRSNVTSEPLPVTLRLLEAEQRLEVVLCKMTSISDHTGVKHRHVLKAKFSAWVGKYRMTLAVLPRQRERRPSSRYVRAKQSLIPL